MFSSTFDILNKIKIKKKWDLFRLFSFFSLSEYHDIIGKGTSTSAGLH
jgi:hypothetical protein